MSAECSAETIPPGYKQTEVGVIPEDWKITTLGEVVSKLVHGGTPSTKYEDYWKGDIPWITGADILDQQVSEIRRFITKNAVKNSSTNVVNKGTLLLVSRTGVGKLAIAPCDIAISQDLTGIYTKSENLNTEYLFRFLDKNQALLKNQNQGTSILGITRETLSSIIIFFPPTLAEQESIAQALSDADALIESLEQLIAKKRQIKQGAMQELLRPKDNWEPTSLGNIADPNQRWSFTGGPFGSNLKSSDYTNDGIRIIQLQNIGDGEFKNDYEVYTSIEKADELLSCNIYPGEIILSKMGDPVARACLIPPYKKRYLMCSDGIRLAVDQKRFNTYFVYTLINASDFRMKAENASTGSTRKRIGLTELRNLELLCPPLSEQNNIATILSDMNSEITALEEKLAKARQIKQGMMQELLTGRIRLI